MSLFDKAVAAVTPLESDEDRAEARQKARDVAQPGDWLSTILDHHLQLEAAFAAVKQASTAETRTAAQKKLGVILTGHAIAEENAVYPAMALGGEKADAAMAYDEQAMVKTQMAALEALDPMSQDYLDKLEHIRGAVAHHIYEEEGTWFPELVRSAPPEDQAKMGQHYDEAFDRFVGQDAGLQPA